MPTNFPTSTDTFDVPVAPVTTALGTPGSALRTHTQNHKDLGDALVAMQGQATYLVHTHDGATFRYGSTLAQANTHQSPDTDTGTGSLHHTIGTGANQYASGTHTHPVVITYPVGYVFMATVSTYPGLTDPVSGNPGLGLVGTWTAVGQNFLCATGGTLGFTLGSTGGSNSHNHSIDATTNSTGAHTHNIPTGTGNSSIGNHSHPAPGTLSVGVSHFHGVFDSGVGSHSVYSGNQNIPAPPTEHYHGASSATPSHSHSTPATGASGDHSHNLSSGVTGSDNNHNHGTNGPTVAANNLIPLFVVFMWQRVS